MRDSMALELIVGPPNSNRAGAVLDRLRAALDRDPLLVVPTGDDIAHFERDLCAGRRGRDRRHDPHLRGALFDEIAASAATPAAAALSPRRSASHWCAPPIASTPLRVLRRSSRLAGLRARPRHADRRAPGRAGRSPADLRWPRPRRRARTRPRSASWLRSTRVRAPSRRRRALGRRLGRRSRGRRAPRRRRTPGATRPCFIYGFDDLTEVQLGLIALLAGVCEVTFAVNYADRDALAARAGLLTRLHEEGGSSRRAARVRPALHGPQSLSPPLAERLRDRPGTVKPLDGGVRVPRQRRRARRGRGGRHRDRSPARGRVRAPDDDRRHASQPVSRRTPVRVRHARDGHPGDARGAPAACLARRSAARSSRSAAPPRTTASRPT